MSKREELITAIEKLSKKPIEKNDFRDLAKMSEKSLIRKLIKIGLALKYPLN